MTNGLAAVPFPNPVKLLGSGAIYWTCKSCGSVLRGRPEFARICGWTFPDDWETNPKPEVKCATCIKETV